MLFLAQLWSFRSFVYGNVRREITARYKGTLLGPAWIVIQPLMMIFIYTVVFSKVMHNRLPGASGGFAYSIHLCAGLLPWLFFSDLLSKMQNVFIDNANLLKKINFPRACLGVIALLVTGFNFLVIFGLFLLFLLVTGNLPGWVILGMLPVLALQIALTLGLGLFLATANVFFRDVGHLVGMLLQFGFWFTPIVYPLSALPEWAQQAVQINPLVGMMDFYQTVFIAHRLGSFSHLASGLVWTVAMLLLGTYVYRRHQLEMVDEL